MTAAKSHSTDHDMSANIRTANDVLEVCRENVDRYRTLLESIGDAIYTIEVERGTTGRLLFERGCASLTGYNPEEIGRDPTGWRIIIHPEDYLRVKDLLQEAIGGVAPVVIEHRIRCKNGSVQWVRNTLVARKDQSGRIMECNGLMTNITKEKTTEEQLRESEQRWKAIADNTTAVIYVKDRHGKYLFANRRFEQLFHRSWQDILGMTDQDLFPVAQAQKFQENDRRVLRQKSPIEVEEVAPHDDGLHTYISLKFPLFNAAGEAYAMCGISTDISTRKRAEEHHAIQYAVTRALSEAGSLTEGIRSILQSVCENTGWNAGFFWRLDRETGALRVMDSWHDADFVVSRLEAMTFKHSHQKGHGLPGRVWEDEQPIWCSDLTETKECPRTLAALFDGLRAGIGIPIHREGEVIGVLEFYSTRCLSPEQEFIQVLAGVGAQIGQFISRKQAEETLEMERNLLRTLIDTLPDLIYFKDTSSRFLLGNASVAQLMGARDVEEICGKTDYDFYPRELAERYYNDEQQVISSGTALINREEPVLTTEGVNRWLLTTKAPVRDGQGRIIGLVGHGRDITERKSIEEQHRITQAQLQAILDNTPALISLKDKAGHYLLINRQWSVFLGLGPDTVPTKTDHDLFPAKVARLLRDHDLKVLQEKAPLEFEETLVHGKENYTFLSIKFPMWNGEGNVYAVCSVSTDITARKRAETELRRTNRQLEKKERRLRQALDELATSHDQLKAAQSQLIQAEKLESVGTLAAGVAHEVKNPLQTILMGLNYLSKSSGIGHEQKSVVLHEMQEAVLRANSIVKELLEFSGTNHPALERSDLNEIIRQSLKMTRYDLIRAKVEVTEELDGTLPKLSLDKNKIQQVFINVLLNAVQAMPAGGQLILRTSLLSLSESGKIDVQAEIDDTGPGIPEETLNRVFDPFYTTKPSGTGLGLSLSRLIIESHQGSFQIFNRPEGGVRVRIAFPLTSNSEISRKKTDFRTPSKVQIQPKGVHHESQKACVARR